MPIDVDDENIYKDQIVSQQGVSLTTGFIIHSRVFWASLGDGGNLRDRLNRLKYMLDCIPQELRQWGTGEGKFACMRANLHVTHLWLQSILLDQVENVEWAEREDIARQLLHVLHGIPQESLEPNGLHLVSFPNVASLLTPKTYKVRDVAVSLLACPFEPHEEPARRASEYLREFTNILSRLDGSEVLNTLSLQSWVDTDRAGRAGW